MWFVGIDLSHDYLVKIRPASLDIFDFDSGERQRLDNLGLRVREGQYFFQPIE
jgi:hypothetical protein